MQNQPPSVHGDMDDKERYKADVQHRPDVASLEAYEATPVASFGEACLRGMGWKKGEAIGGVNKVLVEPAQFLPRPGRLGLGAQVNTELLPEKRRKKYIKPGESRESRVSVQRSAGRVRPCWMGVECTACVGPPWRKFLRCLLLST